MNTLKVAILSLNMVLRQIFLFHIIGAQGEKFYIILQGNVSVLIPNKEFKDNKT